jgi:acetoin utilization protein AcuB
MQISKPIFNYMTPAPKTIGIDQSLEAANDLMRTLQVRHLPVLKGGKIVGLISDRDIKLVLTFANQDALNLPVEEAMSPDPYVVSMDEPLSKVAKVMAKKKYGAAVITDGSKVVGIFTTTDALGALSKFTQGAIG